ncbi:hypothetical protein pb186bvf_010405 [Paramecium bursaria]
MYSKSHSDTFFVQIKQNSNMFKRENSFKEADIQSIIIENFQQWEHLSQNDIKLTPLTGLTNITYKAEALIPATPKAIVFRQFGNAEGFIDHQLEKIIFRTISDKKLGPQEYSCSETWRMEEFIERAEHPNNQTMVDSEFCFNVVGLIQKFHTIDAPLPNKHTSNIIKSIFSEEMRLNAISKIAQSHLFSNEEQEILQLFQDSISDAFEQEYLIQMIKKENHENLVLCHNDLNQLNIFNSNNRPLFIDYEYCSYNYASYDIGNFLNECVINYQHPDEPYYSLVEDNLFHKQLSYFAALTYVTHQKATPEQISIIRQLIVPQCNKDKNLIQQLQKQIENILQQDINDEVQYMKRRIRRMMIMTHLYWVYWSILQSKGSIQFDYINYGMMRFQIYKQLLQEEMKRDAHSKEKTSSIRSTDSDDS